ncbi:hypothetical protein ACH4E8_08035 [Streptomyces sp. NPDC017979]|uniref:hypothetical protein n=1 Tax=Streptomyces sp. NPDC017979 TaxID=3365024 RepID=UPI0037BCDE2B
MTALDWAGAVREAQEATGFRGEVVVRTVEAVRKAVSAARHAEFDQELGALDGGGAFDAFLDHWWTQALADVAPTEDAREHAIDFADLAISLHVRAKGGPTYTSTEVEQMIKKVVS